MNAWVLLSPETARIRLARRPYDAPRPHGPLRRPARESRNCEATRQQRRRRARALRDGVRATMEQIDGLERQLALASSRRVASRANSEAAALELMETYHRLMARGYSPERDAEATAFLHVAIDERFVHQDFTGRDMFLQQWELLSRFHTSLSVDSTSLSLVSPAETTAEAASASGDTGDTGDAGDAGDDDSEDGKAVYVVRSRGVTTMRISRATLEHVFPHVLTDEALVQRLIGREYSFAYTIFAYINESGRLFQMESTVDLASALLEMLSDPFAAVKLVEASTMTKGGNLVMSDVVQAQNAIENGFL